MIGSSCRATSHMLLLGDGFQAFEHLAASERVWMDSLEVASLHVKEDIVSLLEVLISQIGVALRLSLLQLLGGEFWTQDSLQVELEDKSRDEDAHHEVERLGTANDLQLLIEVVDSWLLLLLVELKSLAHELLYLSHLGFDGSFALFSTRSHLSDLTENGLQLLVEFEGCF